MNTEHKQMLEFVKEKLYAGGKDITDGKYQSFRSRYGHTKRVLNWCKRLCGAYGGVVNEYVLYVSAIFHDVGYAASYEESDIPHAEASARIFEDYCSKHEVPFAAEISRNISLHSDKALLKREDTPIELILLMEADLLDETGALSIVFDCMTSGERRLDSYEAAYERIRRYSCMELEDAPMVTPEAIRIMKEKKELVKAFVRSLEIDLNIGEG